MPPSDGGPPDDPRARAARTKRDRTRRALLDAADSAFGSRGWAQTRMEDIAASAGVSAATAYNHFPTKHALLGYVYGPLVRPLAVQAERDIEADRPVVEALIDQVRALARISARYRKLTAALWSAIQEYGTRVEGLPMPDDDADPRVLAPIPDSIRLLAEHGQRTGQLRTFPAASEVAAMVVNLLLIRAINRPEEDPDVTSELLLTVMFGALKPDLLTDPASGERPFRQAR
ncbi:TetR/AcrR family transcriptional regulator [Pseudonocardia sp. TRM90224]|uniref:TetR/AcrR family transcriptional regulator n=1 Tax=Pseudonocardia sp. TRM90224 TaxID=2812678 RepID=UPI001E3466D6|nr:TetR/AcrR family transcriptional regulator [Pseudonocardia sp. TRM90224]